MSLTFAQQAEFKQVQLDIEALKEQLAKRDERIAKLEGSVKRLILGETCEHDDAPINVPRRPECLDQEGFANNPKAQDQYDKTLDLGPQEGDANVS